MKRFFLLAGFLLMALAPLACQQTYSLSASPAQPGPTATPTSSPTKTPTVTPTLTNTPIYSYISESTNVGFSPSAVTILAGQAVVWTDLGPSFVDILMDQFGPANGCTGSGAILGPGASVTYQFNSAPLTIDFQDAFNSNNGGPPCAPQASPYSGEVIVQ